MGTPAGAKAEGVTMMGYREWRERNRNQSSAFLWSPPCREFLFPELYLGTNKSHSLVLIFVQHFVFRAVWLTGWCSPFTKISLQVMHLLELFTINSLVLTAERALSAAKIPIWSATTAKPRPASPALAASILAFNASKFVWDAISSIEPIIESCR